MKTCVAVLVVLVTVLAEGGLANMCEKDVLDRLNELWQEKGVPTNIVENSLKLKEDFVVLTTGGYYKDEGKIHCVSTLWERCGNGATLTSTFVYEDGRNRTDSFSVVEYQGTLIQLEGNFVRYFVPTGDKVNAFVKCQENGEVGPAEGLVKVWPNYKKEDLIAAIKDLQYVLGVELTQEFADSCKEH